MITVFDSSNYAQQVFLKEAYALLAAQGNILNPDEIAAGKFLSLDGYFAHMNHLVSLQPKFTMIPTDESPFEINANTRTINVPASFSKCAGVVGDNMCEIITFTIDRYFDYCFGKLEYRTLRFEDESIETPNYQGVAVMKLKKGHRLFEIKPYVEGTFAKPQRYRTKSLPALGALPSNDDSKDEQLTLI